MTNWETLPAQEYCSSVRDGTHDSPKEVAIGAKLVTTKHLKNGMLDLNSAYNISYEDFNQINKRSKVDQWDVLISMIGTVGEVYFEKNTPNYAIKNLGLFKSRSEDRGKWLYYYFCSPENKAKLISRTRGTTQRYISLGELRKFPVRFPAKPAEMENIINILCDLDDKIELNHRINETLEAMAQAIFKDWFVDFGPVRRKQSGETDPVKILGGLIPDSGRAASIAALFPDRLGGDGLPVGWESGVLSSIATEQKQKAKPGEIISTTPYIGLEHMPRNSITLNEWETAEKVNSNKSVFEKGQILFGKLRPYFHKVGIAPISGICSTDIVVIDAKEQFDRSLICSICSSNEFVDYNTQASSGTRMPRTKWKIMGDFCVAIADIEIRRKYAEIILPMYSKIQQVILENQTLAKTRDYLLPKLMSGEVRVADVGEVA